jgi:hypothetical protein
MAFGRSMRPSKTARGVRPGAAPSRGGPRLQRGMGPGGAPPAGTMASLRAQQAGGAPPPPPPPSGGGSRIASLRAQQAGGAPPPPSGGGSMMNMLSPAVRPGGNGATNNAAVVSGSRPTPMPAIGSTMGGSSMPMPTPMPAVGSTMGGSSMPMPTPQATAGAGSMGGSMIGPKQMGFNKGGKVPKGMHMMPDGRMMKDSEHKKPKKPTKPKKMMGGGTMKYAHGGSVDGCAIRGKTRGRMV